MARSSDSSYSGHTRLTQARASQRARCIKQEADCPPPAYFCSLIVQLPAACHTPSEWRLYQIDVALLQAAPKRRLADQTLWLKRLYRCCSRCLHSLSPSARHFSLSPGLNARFLEYPTIFFQVRDESSRLQSIVANLETERLQVFIKYTSFQEMSARYCVTPGDNDTTIAFAGGSKVATERRRSICIRSFNKHHLHCCWRRPCTGSSHLSISMSS